MKDADILWTGERARRTRVIPAAPTAREPSLPCGGSIMRPVPEYLVTSSPRPADPALSPSLARSVPRVGGSRGPLAAVLFRGSGKMRLTLDQETP